MSEEKSWVRTVEKGMKRAENFELEVEKECQVTIFFQISDYIE